MSDTENVVQLDDYRPQSVTVWACGCGNVHLMVIDLGKQVMCDECGRSWKIEEIQNAPGPRE